MSNDLIMLDSYCELSRTSLSFKKDITKEEWKIVFNKLSHVEGCIQFWIGDSLVYLEQKWGMYDEIAEESGLNKQTLKDYKWVSDTIEPSLRKDDLTFNHHKSVALLPKEQQQEVLQKASDEKLTVRETRDLVKAIKRGDEELKSPEKFEGKYQIIYIDPPWKYPSDKAYYGQDVEKHYPTMTMEELQDMDIKQYAEPDCVLYLWATSPLLDVAIDLLKYWGFDYKTCLVWDKVSHNMGFYASIRHEILLIGGIGQSAPTDKSYANQTDSVYSEKKTEHSKKPDFYYEMIEKMHPTKVKRLEMFARKKVEGWTSWGNEI